MPEGALTHRTQTLLHNGSGAHAQTLASLPWAGPRLLESARAFVQASAVPLYDFDLAFNYWNWIYQFELYGHDHDARRLVWIQT